MILDVIFHHLYDFYFAMKQRIAFSRRGFKNRELYFKQKNSDIDLGVNHSSRLQFKSSFLTAESVVSFCGPFGPQESIH